MNESANPGNVIVWVARFTAKELDTLGAGAYVALPAWSASMVHVPVATSVITPFVVTVHTGTVAEV